MLIDRLMEREAHRRAALRTPGFEDRRGAAMILGLSILLGCAWIGWELYPDWMQRLFLDPLVADSENMLGWFGLVTVSVLVCFLPTFYLISRINKAWGAAFQAEYDRAVLELRQQINKEKENGPTEDE